MNDRSGAGRMYLGGAPGNETRTGLSRLKGGRCWGNRVCWRFGTAANGIAASIPGKKTRTGTFPITNVVEKERFGGVERGATVTVAEPFVYPVFCGCEGVKVLVGLPSRTTVSCKS